MSKVNKSKVEEFSGQKNGREEAGFVTWWDLERNILVPGSQVEQILTKCGFPEKEVDIARDTESAFTRAIGKASTLKQFDGWLIRKILYAEDRIIYGIVKEKIDKKDEELGYKREDKIILKRKTADVEVLESTPEGLSIKKLYKSYKGNVDTWSVIDFILRQVKKLSPLSLREMGGLYFVPARYKEDLDRLESALKEISPSSIFYTMTIYKDDRSTKSLKSVFTEEFKKELEELTKDLDKRIQAENTRPSTLQSRIKEYKEMKERAKIYEDLLNFKAEEIHTKLDDLEAKVKEALIQD